MAATDTPRTHAEIEFVQLADSEGRLLLLPTATVEHYLAAGVALLNLSVNLQPDRAPREWLTATEAAKLHLSDVDGMTLQRAQVRITRACAAGHLIFDGTSTRRRIEPNSLDSWRLAAREKNLDKTDD